RLVPRALVVGLALLVGLARVVRHGRPEARRRLGPGRRPADRPRTTERRPADRPRTTQRRPGRRRRHGRRPIPPGRVLAAGASRLRGVRAVSPTFRLAWLARACRGWLWSGIHLF